MMFWGFSLIIQHGYSYCQTDLTAKTRLSDRAIAHIKAVFINRNSHRFEQNKVSRHILMIESIDII